MKGITKDVGTFRLEYEKSNDSHCCMIRKSGIRVKQKRELEGMKERNLQVITMRNAKKKTRRHHIKNKAVGHNAEKRLKRKQFYT